MAQKWQTSKPSSQCQVKIIVHLFTMYMRSHTFLYRYRWQVPLIAIAIDLFAIRGNGRIADGRLGDGRPLLGTIQPILMARDEPSKVCWPIMLVKRFNLQIESKKTSWFRKYFSCNRHTILGESSDSAKFTRMRTLFWWSQMIFSGFSTAIKNIVPG